jgi:hypothetical protein
LGGDLGSLEVLRGVGVREEDGRRGSGGSHEEGRPSQDTKGRILVLRI